MKQLLSAVVLICLLFTVLFTIGGTQEKPSKMRVGVYDNRAVAIAFFSSKYNPFVEKRAEYQQAIKAADSVRMKQLDEWVQKFQCQIHYQGFCRAPVDDILKLVKDELAQVAKENDLDLIGWQQDYIDDEIEIVDISVELAAIFDPSEERIEEVKKLKDVEPTALCDIEHNH